MVKFLLWPCGRYVAPAPIFCIESARLKDRYQRAVSEYLRLQAAQIAAVINDATDTLQNEIHEADERKDAAKYALIAHLESHGCGM